MKNREQVRVKRQDRVEELAVQLVYVAERLAVVDSVDAKRVLRQDLLRTARRYGYAIRSLSLGVR